MSETKFIRLQSKESDGSASARGASCSSPLRLLTPQTGCCPAPVEKPPAWITGTLSTAAGPVPIVSTVLSRAEYWEHVKCRMSGFRHRYIIKPGLYAAGSPDERSEVLVSANYKLSFDSLRKELSGLNVWILALDTKGINVWCAAGKGTFGSDELISRLGAAQVDRVVAHKRLILPQLGGPGVSSQKVRQATGFSVSFGPVRASDISGYITAGCKATPEMRRVRFPLVDRLVLTPMELNPAFKMYPWFALLTLLFFGLQPRGIIFSDALAGGLPFLLLGVIAIISGAFLTPLLLPFIPFRAFAVKGWIAGIISVFFAMQTIVLYGHMDAVLQAFSYIFFPLASSYIGLQFTGSTTFTGMTGVKKELSIGIPLYFFFSAVSLVLLIVYKLGQWGVL
ncbi:MAG: mercury methylation corrinoid protein HgcA [Thermodesulfovibrionales bacterium]